LTDAGGAAAHRGWKPTALWVSRLPASVDISAKIQLPALTAKQFELCSVFVLFMRTRGDLLWFSIAFALRSARKLVRGLRQELPEDERYRVADDAVHRLQQNGDPWHLSEDLPPPRAGHST
jgi:hypothetical protein